MARLADLAGAGENTARIIFLIARREYLTRVRSRIYLIGTVVLAVLLAGFILLQAFVINRATTTLTIGFVGSTQELAQPLKEAAGSSNLKIQTSMVGDVTSGESRVKSGDLDALVSGDPAAPAVDVKDELDPTVAATLTGLAREVALRRALTTAGVNVTDVESQVAAATIHVRYLDPNAAIRAQQTVVGIFVAALLYVALVIYGGLVSAGVVEEKANRVIEILLSTVKARQLLFCKVLGIGLAGLTQLVLLAVVALIAVSRTQVINLPTVGVTAVAAGLLWFILGFVFYALLFAAGGSLVSRQEDLGAVNTPLTMLPLGAYLSYFWAVGNPTNPIAILLSLLPPFAPVLMPARMATGDAQVWQVVVAVTLMLAAIAGMNALAARIYSNSVLRVGTRVKLLEAWRGRA